MTDLDGVIAARDEWLRVLARGDDSVREEAAARFTACRSALELVGDRLRAIDYPVHPIVRPIDRTVLQHLRDELADNELPMPPLLLTMWEVVGSVSVLDFGRYRHASFWAARIGPTDRTTDGLHIDSPGDSVDECEGYAGYLIDEHEGWAESGLAEEGEPFDWPIAPDDLHKDDVSGSDPYALRPGANAWDHRVVGMAWPAGVVTAPAGAPDLLSYLRTAILECGCFPGLFGLPAFEADRRQLIANLPVF